jgi:hypothetical protein
MRRIAGREMRKLIVAITLMTLALVIMVIAYFMVDIILTTNHNIEENKKIVLEKSIITLRDVGKTVSSLSTNPQFLSLFNQDTINEIIKGDLEALYNLIATFSITVNPLEYSGVIVDGEVVDYDTAPGLELDPGELPARPEDGDYMIINNLGDREGYFISLYYPIDLSSYGIEEFYLNMIMDRTEEMHEVEGYFVEQRNDLVLRMSVVAGIAILLSLLITTIGLRYFTDKYVTKPVEKLNSMATEIIEGTFEGDIEVDKNSAYAALQGLLQSGQKVLHKMDKEMD